MLHLPGKYTSTVLRVLLPVTIGCVAFWLLFGKDFTAQTWQTVPWTRTTVFAIVLAWIFMIGRDFGLSWRFKTLAEGDLSWKNAIRVDMMCEFTSAITPTAVGGSALGMVYLNHEGIDMGRAATLTMTTLFLDELFFVVTCPVIYLLMPDDALFGFSSGGFTDGIRIAFMSVYSGLVLWTALLFVGIFVRPHAVRTILLKIMSCRSLRKWYAATDRMTANIIATSAALRGHNALWWLKIFAATGISWCSRFLVVNALMAGFAPQAPQITAFCRQFVVWVVLIISPTPGGSGLSEWIFTEYYSDLTCSAGATIVLALMWRIISYYVYLIAGLFILPSFLTRRKKSDNHT